MGVSAWRRFTLGKTAHAIDKAVRNVVALAYRAVPLFRERLDTERISPDQIDSKQALALLPPVSRDGRAMIPLDRLLRKGTETERCHVGPTSGTTGTPLMIYMSRAEALFRRIVLFRAMRRCAHVTVPFSIAEVGVGRGGAGRERAFTHRLGLSRTDRIRRDLDPAAQADRLWRTRPQVITGHPSCLEIAAEAIDDLGWAGTLNTRLVACRGEMLSARTRALLERVFACPVSDLYNCEEIGNVAWECPDRQGVMHISTDGCVVEILDRNGIPAAEGQEGDVVLTNLFNLTMPFVRYRIGDRAALLPDGTCSCGHRGPSMSLVAGRADDFIWLPSGRRVSPRVADSIVGLAAADVAAASGFRAAQYRIIQRTPAEIEVRLAMGAQDPGDLPERIRRGFEELSSDIDCRIEVVPSFDDPRGHKVRAITSLVRPPTDSEVG